MLFRNGQSDKAGGAGIEHEVELNSMVAASLAERHPNIKHQGDDEYTELLESIRGNATFLLTAVTVGGAFVEVAA